MSRYNVTAPRKYMKQGEEKTQWMRIGTAFTNERGGIDITLDALPLPEPDRKIDGQMTVRLKAFPADSAPQQPSTPKPSDDDVPF